MKNITVYKNSLAISTPHITMRITRPSWNNRDLLENPIPGYLAGHVSLILEKKGIGYLWTYRRPFRITRIDWL